MERLRTLGITLIIIGFSTAFCIASYYLIDKRRTGILYRKHKKILFPIVLVAFVIFMLGGYLA